MRDLIPEHAWKRNKSASRACPCVYFESYSTELCAYMFFFFQSFNVHFSYFSSKFTSCSQVSLFYSFVKLASLISTCCFRCFFRPEEPGAWPPPVTFWGKQVKPRLKRGGKQCEIQRCSNSLMKRFYKRIGWLAKSEHEKYPTSTLTHIIHYVWWLWE